MNSNNIKNPQSLGSKLGRLWFYLSQILSVIGLAGVLDDLRSWVKFAEWSMTRLRDLSPDLSALLLWAGSAIRAIVALWRSLLHPLIDWFLGWFPFHVPVLVKDLLLVAIFFVVGWSRADALWTSVWNRRRARVSEIAKGFNPKDVYASFTSLRDAKDYVENHQRDRATLSEYQRKTFQRLEESLGDRTLDFAKAIASDRVMLELETEGHKALFVLEPLLKALVVIAALMVTVFIVLDLILS